MADPYKTLGVQKTDSEAAIRSAYRKLAKRYHPDVNPGKPEAAERFKEISAAYDLLGDKEKRARYDRGEIDAAGFDPEDLESIFAQAFGGRTGTAGGRRFSMRGHDAQYQLTLDFLDAVNGA